MSILVAGLDLGQVADYSALAIVEAKGMEWELTVPDHDPEFRGSAGDCERLVSFEGPPVAFTIHYLGRDREVPYPEIVERVRKRICAKPGVDLLAVDATGVGRPVVDLFVQAGLKPLAITITSGTAAHGDGTDWSVPKTELVSAVLVPFQAEHLVIPRSLALSSVLASELSTFKVKITTAANASFGAWREGEHDDLVLAVAMAVWAGNRVIADNAAQVQAQAQLDAFNLEMNVDDYHIGAF